MNTKWTRRVSGVSLVAALAIAIPVRALDYPLTETSIRDAFMTGNEHDGRANELFVKYKHDLAPTDADSGPYIASISLMTPYEQVAERGATAANYHAEEAEQEFLGKPMPFLVRIEIQFTSTYPVYTTEDVGGAHSLLQPLPDYLNDFQIDVSQDKKIASKATREFMINSGYSDTVWGNRGIIIEQEFDPQDIDSSELTVEVHAPGDQDVATTFNLTELR